MKEVEALLDKAGRSFSAAQMLLDAGDADFAASRAYYGWFYVAEALLMSEGRRFSRHGQVVSQYGRLFAATDRLPRRFHRLLGRAFELRQLADYGTDADMDATVVEDLISEGRVFLKTARDHLRDRRKPQSS